MVLALFIFVDDDFGDPIYADPSVPDVDPDLYEQMCEAANDALEGDAASSGSHVQVEEVRIGWRLQGRLGLSLVVAVSDDITSTQVDAYLKGLQKQYLDEVDDPRSPEREGVADVVIDVIPPWEE